MSAVPPPPWILAPDRMAAVDRAAIAAGLPGAALMETAGRAVAEEIRARWPSGRIVVFAGGGNNGGDGLVAARHLDAAGRAVELFLFFDPAEAEGDAALQWGLVEPLGLPTLRVTEVEEARAAVRIAEGAVCVVDALLGTGLSGEVREPARSALAALDAAAVPVVAVDIPSGLDGATGRIRGAVARADLTLTFGLPQPGHFLGDGPKAVGRLELVPLGYPAAALAEAGDRPLAWIRLADAEAALPARRHDLHKGAAGRLLLVAGSERYGGAAALAATGALRSGVGLCVVATPEPVAPHLLAALPEAIVVPLPLTRSGAFGKAAAERVSEAAAEADAVAVGPGLGTGRGVRGIVAAALATDAPAVVDADALNVLADDPDPVEREAATILTPHPGELGRWLGRPAASIDADRVAAARAVAGERGVHVVLKGSPTVVASPDGHAALNLTGNPGLATGGSGDVLTGLAGSLLAQGIDPAVAARAAPCLHGLAADWAAADLGERGMKPGDLFRYLPLAIRELAAGRGAELVARLEHRYAALLAGGA